MFVFNFNVDDELLLLLLLLLLCGALHVVLLLLVVAVQPMGMYVGEMASPSARIRQNYSANQCTTISTIKQTVFISSNASKYLKMINMIEKHFLYN
jgi:hypothetical protein